MATRLHIPFNLVRGSYEGVGDEPLRDPNPRGQSVDAGAEECLRLYTA